MNVRFAPETGEFLMDQSAFDQLINWAAAGDPPGPELEEFRQAGVISADGLHDTLVPPITAVMDPSCQLRIDVFDHDGSERCADGWLNGNTGALLADRASGMRHFFEVHPTLIPAVVAKLVKLQPRPRFTSETEPLLMPRSSLEGLLGASVAEREAAASRFTSTGDAPHPVIDVLVPGPWRRWSVTSMWVEPSGRPASYGLQVIDTDQGMWRCEASGVDASLWPTRSTDVWRALTRLLPDEVEEP